MNELEIQFTLKVLLHLGLCFEEEEGSQILSPFGGSAWTLLMGTSHFS